tara:strand:- start:84 stop:410 length:327 start_codon:yes stop_codon:yes gene_type:complete
MKGHHKDTPMYKMKITSNHHHRHYTHRYDVPQEVLDWYDWLTEEESFDGWIKYHGHWSHISEYERLPDIINTEWSGYKNDCMSSGTLIKPSIDGETYQIAYYVSVYQD